MFPLTFRELRTMFRHHLRQVVVQAEPHEFRTVLIGSATIDPQTFDPRAASDESSDDFRVTHLNLERRPVTRLERCAFRTSLTRRLLVAAFAAIGLVPTNAGAGQTTLSDLLNGGEIVSGDKLFFGFENYLQSGNLNIDPATIDVFSIATLQPNGTTEYGIRFQRSGGWELEGANKLYDMSLDFLVTTTLPGVFISDNTLEFTGNHVGGGEAHLVEGVTDFQTGDTLANKEVFINIANTGVDKLIDHQIFAHFAKTIAISKDFQLQTRDSANDNIFVSHFDQTFSQVPEPGSVILMGIGGLAVIGYRRRIRRERNLI